MSDTKPIDDGGPAYPFTDFDDDGHRSPYNASDGMSLRDWFAGQTLAGPVAATVEANFTNGAGTTYADMAKLAYLVADAMLAARKAVQP